MNIFNHARTRYILHHHAIAYNQWAGVTEKLSVLQGMTAVEKAHLRKLTTLFMHEKKFFGAQDFQLTDAMCLIIAVQACLPALELGIRCLSGWTEIIVYPAAFRISRDVKDAAGVVHHQEQALIGESWSRGPLIVSWNDVERDMQEKQSGRNVVIHEIAHKLDMLNGPADGFPPLPHGMAVPEWTTALSETYASLVRQVEAQHLTSINPYAATSPAEFFAVISEYFFCAPHTLHNRFADVYQQLQLYYRQNPLARSLPIY
ncbi:MAG: zinc-dependent peptidase [Methylicorpusculum sp.]|uniref:M90 family metallopeptidase n=1 Tax=Methylicorpusculum sp. TaxID=2713644 RepID=UPI00271BA5F3|nr:M90 family metallopeptidase [Methylicorpusculum sp.]MDO8842883.1 zinc-dependent peptidase [Methylicorpusculum sp.]MDO8940833.1 zinc-dependent peptidase [Methylicorpusculum sp.]MDO9241727.1 zinc-dependent peptidase [Methylicorpusculum sp.]MDP2204403.1 zinc-dependent peptidase [Methylicorpusculum sp.]